jgi:hypothetical protein
MEGQEGGEAQGVADPQKTILSSEKNNRNFGFMEHNHF